MTIGENIKKIRKEKGLTQKELGNLCHIDAANIRKYENGKQNPKTETLDKIAAALDVIVYYDHKAHQKRLIAKEDVNSLAYENSYSYASSAKELDKRLEERKKIEEEAAKKAPRLVAYDENGNKIEGGSVRFTDKSMSFEESLAEAEAEELERIQTAYKQLNRKGKVKAVERVEELTEISRYTKEDPPRDPFFMLPKNKRKR